jgi:hypothetical protein
MCGCLALLIGSAAPRFTIFLIWIFSDWTSRAFESFWVGFAGFLLLPYTTLLYVLMDHWQDGVSGFGWAFVILGLLLDLGSYTGGFQRRDEAYGYLQRPR